MAATRTRTAGAVVTCSALKRSYRDVLAAGAADGWFLHLDGTPELMVERVAGRPHHFMPADLVQSQFETLEPPGRRTSAPCVRRREPAAGPDRRRVPGPANRPD